MGSSRKPLSFEAIHASLQSPFAEDLHARRVPSLAGATRGVIQTASPAVAMIGQGLAPARGRPPKQVDRLPSSQGIDVDALPAHWVPSIVGTRSSIAVAMDWTELAADGQATLMSASPTEHGRATPLVWLTVDTATPKGRRDGVEHQVLARLAEMPPAAVRVRIVADRGSGDHKLHRALTEEPRFDLVIRFRGGITATAASGDRRGAAEWAGAGGRARVPRGAAVTAERCEVGTVLRVRDKDMRQPWCLAASGPDEPARALIDLHAERWSIECGFRDGRDIRFGLGMGAVHVTTPDRRDRLRSLDAFAVAPPTPPGAAGEALGHDRHLRTDTAKRRTHSPLRRGHMLYEPIPNMPEHRLQPLIECSAGRLAEQPVFAKAFGAI